MLAALSIATECFIHSSKKKKITKHFFILHCHMCEHTTNIQKLLQILYISLVIHCFCLGKSLLFPSVRCILSIECACGCQRRLREQPTSLKQFWMLEACYGQSSKFQSKFGSSKREQLRRTLILQGFFSYNIQHTKQVKGNLYQRLL